MGVARHIVAIALVSVVSACATPSIRTAGDTTALNVMSVSVDTSQMMVEGRTLKVTHTQLKSDMEAAVLSAVAPESDANGTPVDVAIAVSKMRLASPLARVVADTSSLTGTVRVTEVGTGREVVPATEVTGNTKNIRGAGVIGLATTVSVEKDYRGTLAGFANTVRKALFGSEQ